MKTLSILGSTGSIGVNTLEIVAAFPERYRVIALAAGTNSRRLAEQIRSFRPEVVAMATPQAADELKRLLKDECPRLLAGTEGMLACATHPDAQMVVSAIVGAAGLVPTMGAIESGKDVALANKETLVTAGPLVMDAVAQQKVRLFPIDSEHSAIFQSLQGHRRDDVRRLILTASGGPFRDYGAQQLSQVTPEQALKHPNWEMGRKITIDSATLMNKGLEVIEASFLFQLPPEQIDVHIHPESIVHSMVEYIDGSVISQMGLPDMKAPIAYALSWPERLKLDVPRLDLCHHATLSFSEPDRLRFPCLDLAYQALKIGGTAPAVLNAANEVAVEAFLSGQIGFDRIAGLVDAALQLHQPEALVDVAGVLRVDRWARETVRQQIATMGVLT